MQSKDPINLRPVPPKPPHWRLQHEDRFFSNDQQEKSKEGKRQRGPRLLPPELEEALGQVHDLPLWEGLELVKELQRHGRMDDALMLGLTLLERIEADPESQNYGVAPAYYERVAVILRKLGRRKEEIAILERFAKQKQAPATNPNQLIQRLEKLRDAEP